jgi:hypothetical protein
VDHPTHNPTEEGGDAQIPEYNLKKLSIKLRKDRDLFCPFRISSYQASKLVNPCPVVAARCSLELMLSDTLLDASFSKPKPISKRRNRLSPLLRLRFKFLS